MSQPGDEPDDFGARMKRLGNLIEDVERSAPPAALEPARALLQAVLDVHQSGLRELLATLAALPRGTHVDPVAAVCERASVASMLLMHDLHPKTFAERIAQALDDTNRDASGQAQAELVLIDDLRVSLRVHGGQGGAALMLRRALERAMGECAPEAELSITGGEPPATAEQLVPLSRLQVRSRGAQP